MQCRLCGYEFTEEEAKKAELAKLEAKKAYEEKEEALRKANEDKLLREEAQKQAAEAQVVAQNATIEKDKAQKEAGTARQYQLCESIYWHRRSRAYLSGSNGSLWNGAA